MTQCHNLKENNDNQTS